MAQAFAGLQAIADFWFQNLSRRLGDRPVRAVMTPRREVDMIDLSDNPRAIRKANRQTSERTVVRREDGSLLISGSMPVDEFAELAGIRLPADRD